MNGARSSCFTSALRHLESRSRRAGCQPATGKAWSGVGVLVGMKPKHAAVAVAAAGDGVDAHADGGLQSIGGTSLWLPPRALSGAMIAQVLLIAGLAVTVGLSGAGLSPAGWGVGLTCGVITNAALARGLSYYRADRLRPADWVTLARATLAVGVAALIADSFGQPAPVTLLVALAALALALDAVDGWVARRTRTTAKLGARFDAEVDAFLILILSVYVARLAGAWVFAIGAARYAFLAAGWLLPWMREPLPPRYWRKVVAATQGIVLTIVAADVLPPAPARAALVVALALLAESFGRDVCWLWRNRHGGHPQITPNADPTLGLAPAGPSRGRVRGSVAAVLTILAALLVWAILVAPDQPRYLTPSGFVRLPLEGLILIALALVLPATGRRVLAVIVGLALTLVVVLKIINYGIFTTFDRPFDPLGDTSQLGNGLETLRSLVGRTETNLIEVAVVVGVVVLVVLATLAMLRLTRVAAANRRWALRAVTGLGAVWALCWVSGVQLISHTPIASTLTAGLIVDQVHALQADIHDRSVFAKQINHDPFRNTPTDQLLTSLRGKDVLLVFVEAYGQLAVQGSSFSPQVDTALAEGNKRLQSAGFSARSGFVTSATFGGISWLAHTSLQSGLWVNSQLRYNQLMTAKRFTLADAFKRAGWRTVDDVPSNDRAWPQGSRYYHWDKIYDRYQVGYRGPTFTYASMPDQYIFAALQRLELGKPHRRPLFAEVDTVSSHMPWNRIPEEVDWNQVGNGSIYNRIPMDHETGAFWSNSRRVQAAYGRSIVYALNTLTSFVRHYGRKNLVMIVLGDHQPLPIVSGQGANHDVPISIIAHDPAVLKRIRSWGWGPGLRPAPNAPVWPMSAFRDRFFRAFDSKPPTL
jgi:phosphatidylglycerophosphate synthase